MRTARSRRRAKGHRVVAPLVGAALYAAFGGGVAAILESATFAGSAFLLGRMRVPKPKPAEHHFARALSAGVRHVWPTLPLRQVAVGVTVPLLVLGFEETLIFSVISQLGRPPSFFGVLMTAQEAGTFRGPDTCSHGAAYPRPPSGLPPRDRFAMARDLVPGRGRRRRLRRAASRAGAD
jgi:hypothetical protein